MVLVDAGGTTVILTGSAQLDEFTTLATAVVKALDTKAGASPGSTAVATVSPSAATSP